jgi:integrase
MSTSRDVVFYRIRTIKQATRRPYNFRWRVGKGNKPFSEYYAEEPAAEARKTELAYWYGKGVEFDCETGLPLPMLAEKLEAERKAAEAAATAAQADRSNLCLWQAREFVKAKWDSSSGNYRAGIAGTLRDLMIALLPERPGWMGAKEQSRALANYAFNPKEDLATLRDDDPLAADILDWAEAHSPNVAVLGDLAVIRVILNAFTQCWADRRYEKRRQSSPDHLNKRRAIFSSFINHLLVEGVIEDNPLAHPRLGWKPSTEMKTIKPVDPREVGNQAQVERMLIAVGYSKQHGPRYVGYFAAMYYSMGRPEEVIKLDLDHCELPRQKGKWGEVLFEGAEPWIGSRWSDDGTASEKRSLKHRGAKETRPVPLPPRGVELIKRHLAQFPPGDDGRLFTRPCGKKPSQGVLGGIWQRARDFALTPTQRAGMLLYRPYSLRHSGISARLYSGVTPIQVAAWAGHTVSEQQQTYAKVVGGYESRWKDQMDSFIADDDF